MYLSNNYIIGNEVGIKFNIIQASHLESFSLVKFIFPAQIKTNKIKEVTVNSIKMVNNDL